MNKKTDRPTGIYIPKGRRKLDETKDKDVNADVIETANSIKKIELSISKSKNKNIEIISSDDNDATKPNSSTEIKNKVESADGNNKVASSTNNIISDTITTNTITNSNSVNSIAAKSNSILMPTSKSDRPVGIYIPKGRRMLETQKVSNCFQKELIDEEEQNDNNHKNNSKINKMDSTIAWMERFEKVDRVSEFTPSMEVEPMSYETNINITDEMILDHCLIITNIAIETSEIIKNNICQSYQNAGGIIKWINPQECLIVFKNEKSLITSLSTSSSYNKCTFKVQRLKDYNNKNDYIQVAYPILQAIIKPERDSTVANRLIGAALGIKLPTKTKNNQIFDRDHLQQPLPVRQRIKSPVKKDAWDD